VSPGQREKRPLWRIGEDARSRGSQAFSTGKEVRQFISIAFNVRARDQSSRFGLAKRLGEDFAGDFAADVDNGPDRPSHPISLPFLYLVSGKIVVVENQNGRHLRATAKPSWHRQVQLGRHHIREIVNAQSRPMRVGALDLIVAVSRPKGPKDQVWTFGHGKPSQSVNTPMFPLPVPGPHVISMMCAVETRILGLFGREKAALSFRDGEKSGFGVLGRPFHQQK
jgi:hypothetical protein